jgi:CRP-like cAMP-binding protein
LPDGATGPGFSGLCFKAILCVKRKALRAKGNHYMIDLSVMPRTIELSTTEKYEVFKKAWSFETSREETLSELTSLATAHQFNKGEIIFHEDDPCRFFHIIKEGRVKNFKQSPSGKHFVASVAGPGDTLSAVVLFSGNPYFLSAQTMDTVILLRINRNDFLSIITKDSGALLRQITVMEQVVRSTCDRLIDLVGERVEQRIYNMLYMLHGKFGSELRFTSEEMAELSGTTAETIIRIFAGLKNLHIISCGRRKIHVLNSSELRSICRASDHAPGRL